MMGKLLPPFSFERKKEKIQMTSRLSPKRKYWLLHA
jgi:hypothetical protein